jgi:hypothetical protein
MKGLLLFLFVIYGSYLNAQQQWQWTSGLENHFQFNQLEVKNIEPANAFANMQRAPFSGTEGAGLSLGVVRKADSSNLMSSIGVQHIWSTLVTAGSTVDTSFQKSEFIQATQTNLKLGLGYANPGRYKYTIQAGPIVPLRNKSQSSIYYKGNGDEFTAYYDTKFKTSIGLWLSADYQFYINSKMQGYFGIGAQVLNRNIASRTLTGFDKSSGTTNQSDYAPGVYHQEYEFKSELSGGMNDAVTNPGGVDFNKPRELLTQSYSFSSLYLQFGIKHLLF